MRRIFLPFLALVFLLTVQIGFAEEIVQDVIKHLEGLHIQTGDLLFWATNEIDSCLIQKFTDGPYSHAGIFSVAPDGTILMYDVHPMGGVRRSSSQDFFGVDQSKVVSMAVVRYKGTVNREDLLKRLDQFLARKDQVIFDQSMALEGGSGYLALLQGKKLALYCTEFVYRLYEGIYSGPVFFENDYPLIYGKRDIFRSMPEDAEIYGEFKQWIGVNPVQRFQEWLTSHKSRVIISANGMLRGGGFEVLYEKSDKTRLKSWAVQLFEMPIQDTSISQATQ